MVVLSYKSINRGVMSNHSGGICNSIRSATLANFQGGRDIHVRSGGNITEVVAQFLFEKQLVIGSLKRRGLSVRSNARARLVSSLGIICFTHHL